MAETIYTCPECSTTMTSNLTDMTLLVCRQCHAIVFCKLEIRKQIRKTEVPQDWSFIQLGTSFTHKNESLKIVGRVRLQLRNDYKNFWCGEFRSGKHVWLMDSFASLAILESPWETFSGSIKHLHADSSIKLSKELSVKGEFVEKCEGISFEGRIGDWRIFEPGFFFTQASDTSGSVCVFTIDRNNDSIQYLAGSKTVVENLHLQNILAWNEWR